MPVVCSETIVKFCYIIFTGREGNIAVVNRSFANDGSAERVCDDPRKRNNFRIFLSFSRKRPAIVSSNSEMSDALMPR